MLFVLLLDGVGVVVASAREGARVSHGSRVGQLGGARQVRSSVGLETTVEVVGAVLDDVVGLVDGQVLDQSVDFLLVGGIERRHTGLQQAGHRQCGDQVEWAKLGTRSATQSTDLPWTATRSAGWSDWLACCGGRSIDLERWGSRDLHLLPPWQRLSCCKLTKLDRLHS